MIDVLSYKFVKKLRVLPFVEAIFLFGSRTQSKHSNTYQEELALEIYQRIPAYLKEMQKVCGDITRLC